jgi:hypothetical protein
MITITVVLLVSPDRAGQNADQNNDDRLRRERGGVMWGLAKDSGEDTMRNVVQTRAVYRVVHLYETMPRLHPDDPRLTIPVEL